MVKQEAEPSFKVALSISFLVVLTVVLTILLFSFVEVDAQTLTHSQTFGITLSKSCQLSEQCPTYFELEQEFDNTNQFYSGIFNYTKDGIYERQPANYKNHWNFYTNPNLIVITVDPSGDWIPKLDHHIIIQPSEFSYFKAQDMKIEPRYENVTKWKPKQICADYRLDACWTVEEYTDQIKLEPQRTERVNQYINSCSRATIHFSALQDTMNQFLSDCKAEQTNEYVLNIPLPQIPFNYADSEWAKYAKWMQSAKTGCKDQC